MGRAMLTAEETMLSADRVSAAAGVGESTGMQAMVNLLLQGKRPSQHKMMEAGIHRVNLKATAKRLEGKLPQEMVSLVGTGHRDPEVPTFSEDSLAKALSVLNKLVEAGWKELDDKLIECKEFEEKNRGTYDQVMTDIARLAENIADYERERNKAQQCINDKEESIIKVTAELKAATIAYTIKHLANQREMNIRKNDLAVFQFMMTLTKCQTTFVQLHNGARICQAHDGFLQLNFKDEQAQRKLERMMTPSARRLLHQLLGTVGGASLLQEAATRHVERAPNGTSAADDDTMSAPTAKQAVVKEVPPQFGKFKCNKGPPDCGLLHDKMSLLWGKYKDLVDELQQEMDKNEFEFEELKTNYNEQLTVLKNAKTTCIS